MKKTKIIILIAIIAVTLAVIGSAFFIKYLRDENAPESAEQEATETKSGEYNDPHMLPEWDIVED